MTRADKAEGELQLALARVQKAESEIQAVASEGFRADNRVVLTYLPELPPADIAAKDEEADETPAGETVEQDADEEVAA